MSRAEHPESGIDQHREWRSHEWSEKDCQCYVGPIYRPRPVRARVRPIRRERCLRADSLRPTGCLEGLWQCGSCPDTHTVLVCDECRPHHDADSTTDRGAILVWFSAQL